MEFFPAFDITREWIHFGGTSTPHDDGSDDGRHSTKLTEQCLRRESWVWRKHSQKQQINSEDKDSVSPPDWWSSKVNNWVGLISHSCSRGSSKPLGISVGEGSWGALRGHFFLYRDGTRLIAFVCYLCFVMILRIIACLMGNQSNVEGRAASG